MVYQKCFVICGLSKSIKTKIPCMQFWGIHILKYSHLMAQSKENCQQTQQTNNIRRFPKMLDPQVTMAFSILPSGNLTYSY